MQADAKGIKKDMKIVVLCGGTSSERAVSIVSGQGVCTALRQRGHRAILLDVFFGDEAIDPANAFPEAYDIEGAAAAIRARDPELAQEQASRRVFFGPNVMEICSLADVVFMALHGANGEDGKVQACFDLFGIPYTGSGHLSSALAMDKTMSKQAFLAHDLPTPPGFSILKTDPIRMPGEAGLAYPVIVKPCCGGSSVGVTIANDDNEYREALEVSFALEEEAIVESFISGREFSVAVIDDEAYPVIEIAPKEGFYDYKNKYAEGAVVETCPADIEDAITKKMQDLAVRGARALGITAYCRLDFLMDEGGALYILEANTLPGMTPTSLIPQEAAVLGISYPELCEKLILVSLSHADDEKEIR